MNVAIVGEEPGYGHRSTYYGLKDILAIGAGFEYQNGELGVATPATATAPAVPAPVIGDLTLGILDLLAEKKFGDAGVGTLEGAYYHYDTAYAVRHAYFGLAAYMLPWRLGVGRLQAVGRLQQAFSQNGS